MKLFMTLPTEPGNDRYMILQDEDDGSLHWMKEGRHESLVEFPPMDDPWYATEDK